MSASGGTASRGGLYPWEGGFASRGICSLIYFTQQLPSETWRTHCSLDILILPPYPESALHEDVNRTIEIPQRARILRLATV